MLDTGRNVWIIGSVFQAFLIPTKSLENRAFSSLVGSVFVSKFLVMNFEAVSRANTSGISSQPNQQSKPSAKPRPESESAWSDFIIAG